MASKYLVKLSHLSDLIKLSRADGFVSPMETCYIDSVAAKLGVDPIDVNKLRKDELRVRFSPPRHEYEIIPQFYRMLRLIGADRMIYKEEIYLCSELSLRMGLHPAAVKEAMDRMTCYPGISLAECEVESIFRKYYN